MFIWLKLTFLSHLVINLANCKVIGGAILPHGDFAYDPSLVNFENGSYELHNASIEVGEWISNIMKPDLIFLSTPHGLELAIDFLIYENQNESGYALLGGDLDNSSFIEYKVELNMTTDESLAINLVNSLSKGTNDDSKVYNLTGLKGKSTS